MSKGTQVSSLFGSDLIDADYQKLEARWISPELVAEAGLRRVDTYTGREMFGRKSGIVPESSFPTCSRARTRL